MPSIAELAQRFRSKESAELRSMLLCPSDWSDEALSAAKMELGMRGEEVFEPQPEELAIPSVRYGGFLDRFFAALIDGFILNVGVFVVGIFIVWNQTEIKLEFIPLFFVVFGWLYYAFMESSAKGATIGKRALGLRVTNMDGDQVGFGKASGRYFGKYLSSLFAVGFLMALFTKRKQALHDLLSGCVVLCQSR